MDEGPRPKVAALFLFSRSYCSEWAGPRPCEARGIKGTRAAGKSSPGAPAKACLPPPGQARAHKRGNRREWWEYPRVKKSRAHESFDSCALFQLSRKVFMLPGSICRENIPAPFSWQEVSLSFSVETCAPLCKSLAPVVAPHFHTSALGCARLVSRLCCARKRTSVRQRLPG